MTAFSAGVLQAKLYFDSSRNMYATPRIPYYMEIRKFIKRIVFFLFAIVLVLVFLEAEPAEKKEKKIYILSDTEVFGNGLEWEVVQTHLPVFGYLFHEQNKNNSYEVLISNLSPLYQYLLVQEAVEQGMEKRTDLALGEELEKQLLRENTSKHLKEDDSANEMIQGDEGQTEQAEDNQEQEEAMEEAIDVASIFLTPTEFEPMTEKQREYDWNTFSDSEMLRKEFFAVDATTEIEDERINPGLLLEKEIALSEPNGGPQILIYHTHSQETFADSIQGDVNTSIVGAGEYLTNLLKEEYGYEVLHHTGEYDVETRDYAYSYALPNIEAILQEYPSIEVVIDLHRDAVAEDRKLVSEQNGKQAAQVMFFNGLSHTVKQGDIDYLENPYIEDNLAFSFQMQVLCNEYYPGLTRRIYLKGYRYNMHLRPQSLLIELGAQTNTCEEIRNSLDIIAHVLSMCLEGEKEG